MEILPSGLPIHADATIRLRPRIFLEGNFYADLQPGSPTAPTLHSGATLAAANTSGPVQLDRVLSALNSDSRTDLQTLLRGLGSSLYEPPRTTDRTQDPLTRSLSGGQALNQSLRFSVDAFRASAIVNQALLGSHPGDLTRVVQGNRAAVPLARRRRAPAAGAHQHVRRHDGDAGRPPEPSSSRRSRICRRCSQRTQSSDTALDRSFAPDDRVRQRHPPRTASARPDDRPGAAVAGAGDGARRRPSELRGLLTDLTPAVQNTAASLSATRSLLSASGALARCFTHNIIPAGNQRISDPPITTGLQVYQEFFQSAVGLAGAAGNFDGNGRFLRAVAGGGPYQQATPSIPSNGPEYGNFVTPAARHPPGVRGQSAAAAARRALRPQRGSQPELGEDRSGAMRRAIRVHERDFARDRRAAARCAGHGRLHPRPPAVLHLRAQLLPGQGAVPDRRRGDRRPGAVGRRRRSPGRRGRRRHAPGRPGGGADEHRQAVRPDLPRCHGTAAPANSAEGHVPLARSRHPGGRRDRRAAAS